MKTKELLKEWKNFINESTPGIYDDPEQYIDFTNDEDFFDEYKQYCEEILGGVDYDPNSFDAGHKALYTRLVTNIKNDCEEYKKKLEYERKSNNLYYDHYAFKDLESKELKDEKFNEFIRGYEAERDRRIAALKNPDGTINSELVYKMSPTSDISYITYNAKFVLDTEGHLYIKMKDGSLSSVTDEVLPFRDEGK